jgi:spore germination protein GerM
LAIAALGLLLLSCETAGLPKAPNAAPSGSGAAGPSSLPASGSTTSFTLYLPRLFEDGSLGLRGVSRSLVWSEAPARDAMEQLIQGPNGNERAADFHYPLDRSTRLRSATISDGTATLDFARGLEKVHGNPFSELTYWSILYTATEVPGVERVRLLNGGSPLTALGFPPFSVRGIGSRVDAPAWAMPR